MANKISRKSFRNRLNDMVVSLREEIISGRLAVDSYLPSENDLEIRYQLSNNSVRKGLETLVEEGLIEKIPRVGNRVTLPPQSQATILKFGFVQSIANIAGMDKLLAAFHLQYPHIRVQTLELPSASYSRSLKQYMEAELLDVVMMNNNNFQDFVEASKTGLLEPLEPDSELYPFLSKPFRQGDRERTLVQPYIFSPVVLCYNKEHLREAQVPEPDSSWTWQDLFRYGKQLAVPQERFGFYFYLPSRNRWPIFMLQNEDRFRPDAKGEYDLTDSKMIAGLETCRELLAMTDVFPTILSESDADAEALFLEGKVSIIMTTYFFLNQLKDSGISFDVSPIPGLLDNKTLNIVNGLSINSRSRSKEAAKLLVSFLTSFEAQLIIRRETLNITAHRRVMEWQGEEAVYRPSRFFMYREIIPTFQFITELGLTNNQLREMQRDIMLFLSGMQNRAALIDRLEQLLPAAAQKSVF